MGITRIPLTDEDIKTIEYGLHSELHIILKSMKSKQLKKQILDDYEFYSSMHGIKEYEELKEKAEKWDKLEGNEFEKTYYTLFYSSQKANTKLEQENNIIKNRNEIMNSQLLKKDEIVQKVREQIINPFFDDVLQGVGDYPDVTDVMKKLKEILGEK